MIEERPCARLVAGLTFIKPMSARISKTVRVCARAQVRVRVHG